MIPIRSVEGHDFVGQIAAVEHIVAVEHNSVEQG